MGKVYLLIEMGMVQRHKIGITRKDVNQRIKQLTTGNSNEIRLFKVYETENYRKVEKALHRMYSRYCTEDGGTEWFELPNEEVLKFIEECEKVDKNIKLLQSSGNPYL